MANVIAVAALNKYVKSLLEGDPNLVDIAIRGEISNFNRNYKSGHCYFSLKDAAASVKAVMFRSDAQRLAFQPQNGMQVLARCRVSLYERDGAYQLYVQDIFPDGVGAAQMAFEQLKARLNAEGLFANECKKELPPHPGCIGLVTSKTGAALQDILQVAARRCPLAHFKLVPVTVQGSGAAGQIAAAIQTLDADKDVEVIIVARGGGSAEDLWVFNAEEIARAVFKAATPLISAIGHEIDFTILDFVADLRAPTPSAAAEMALPDIAQTYTKLQNIYKNMANIMQYKLDSWYNIFAYAKNHAVLRQTQALPTVGTAAVNRLQTGVRASAREKTLDASVRLQASARLAASLNPYAVLARGYGVVKLGGKALASVGGVSQGARLSVMLADGTLDCTVNKVNDTAGSRNG